MKNEYCVYVHTNKTNGKRYVGITSMSPERRWANGSGYRHNTLFYRAINKYGWDGFSHEVIKTGLTKEEAYRYEMSLIADWCLTNPAKGYNLDRGGNGSNRITEATRKTLADASRAYVKEHPEVGKRLCEYSKTHRAELSERAKKRAIEHPEIGKMHSERMKIYWGDHPETVAASRSKCRKYYNDHPEARDLKSEQTRAYFAAHPEARAHNAAKTREYYQNPEVKKWKSEERRKFFAEHPEKKTTKAVSQYSIDGELIAAFVSAREAEQHTGVSHTNISSAVTGKQKTAGGYIWRYSDGLQNKTV